MTRDAKNTDKLRAKHISVTELLTLTENRLSSDGSHQETYQPNSPQHFKGEKNQDYINKCQKWFHRKDLEDLSPNKQFLK